jgi:nitric oxide dioxygenase
MTLASMVDHLDDPDTFRRECIELGRRHVCYGAQPAHYPVVGQILLEEFGKWQVPPMTEREISLWQKLYGLVSEQMIAAA